jgi:hypothetical protein
MDQGKEPRLVPETCLDTHTTSTMYHNFHMRPLIEILLVTKRAKIRVQELLSTYQRPATSYPVRLLFSGNKQFLYLEPKRGKLSASTQQQLFHFLMNKINTLTKY